MNSFAAVLRFNRVDRGLTFQDGNSSPHVPFYELTVIALLLLLNGCQQPTLNTRYGTREGQGASSVNGTAILGELFEEAGFQVISWRRLSPRLDRQQVIVWAPDRFQVPYPSEVDYLDAWLRGAPNRTLVYVGRDYDAEGDYWQSVLSHAAPANRLKIRQRAAMAEARYQRRRDALDESGECEWFQLHHRAHARAAQPLVGPWAAAGGTPTAIQIAAYPSPRGFKNVREIPTDTVDQDDVQWQLNPLLADQDGRPLVTEIQRDQWQPGSKLILIANGSWLLNYPLIHPPHQRMAAKLVNACGPPSRVCFLQSAAGEMMISDGDPHVPLILRVFTVFPVNLLAFHAIMIGILYCFYAFPIFGRPRRLPADQVSDFGKHVTAVGELLERGRHKAYAERQLKQYRMSLDDQRTDGKQ